MTGTKGNIEYLLYMKKKPADEEPDIDEIVQTSHQELV